MAMSPRFTKLLESCQEMEFSHLRPLLDRMFENADIALLDFAEKAESNMAQSVFFEAMNEVRNKRQALEQHFFAELVTSFTEFPTSPDAAGTPPDVDDQHDTLSLVDTDAMETTVAMLNATGKLASRIMDRIFALKQRLAVINDGNSIDENQIPGGPSWLGAAFRDAVEHLELQNKVRLVFIALFDKYVLCKADTLFDEYNKKLILADILPNLRYEVRKQPGSVEIVQRTVKDQSEQFAAPVDWEEPAQEQSPSELGDELFGRICELMAGRRPAASAVYSGAGNVTPIHSRDSRTTDAPAGAGPSLPSGAASPLLAQLNTLQSRIQTASAALSSSEFIENIEIDRNLIDRLQNTLSEERDKIFGDVDRRKVPVADANVIELVGMLFEYMLKEENLPNVVKALLSRLHTPLLKVAILDRQFFTRTQHPARKLLNDMTSAGIRWVDETRIDRGVFPKMKEIVDRILLDFDQDVAIFETVSEEFDEFVAQLKQRASLVEQRAAEAASGQDKLHAARERAQCEINDLCHGHPVGEATLAFLRGVWADKLTFILLRNPEGDQSQDWQASSALATRVINAGVAPANEPDRERRRSTLAALQQEIRESVKTLQQADKEKLLSTLFDDQQRVLEGEIAAHAAPQAVVRQEVMPESAKSRKHEAAPLTPEQAEMIDKLKAVPFGTWFEFSRGDAETQRAKLSWRSTITEKFMFVDQMGVKAAVISMRELADCMIGGKVRIIAVEKKPFVDRALSAIHRMLDRNVKETASA